MVFAQGFEMSPPVRGVFRGSETVNTNTNTTANIATTTTTARVVCANGVDAIDAIAPIIDVSTATYNGRSCPRVEAAIDRIIALVGDAQFVRHDRWCGEDDMIDGYTPGGQSNRTMTGSELLTWVERDIYNIERRYCKVVNGLGFYYSFDEDGRQRIYKDSNHRVNSDAIVALLERVKGPKTFVKLVNSTLIDNSECTLYTAKQWAEIERQKLRTECEEAASQLMHKHALNRIDCLDTIKAIYADLDASDREYQAHMDPEARLHRYGMHKGSGSDAYHQDEDQATLRKLNTDNGLHRLLTYMRLYFPLLWSEWNATQKGK